MKTVSISVLVLVILGVISCVDSGIEVNPEAEPLTITILDSETDKPLEGYTLEMYYLTILDRSHVINHKFMIFPTPFFGKTSFEFELDFQSNAELMIYNLTTEQSNVLLSQSLYAGGYIFSFNFQDSMHYSGGLHKAYLKINDMMKDSTSFLFTKSKDTLYFSINRDLFYINSYATDKHGKIDYSKLKFNLVGENVNIVSYNGSFLGSWLITNEVKCIVYNKELQEVKRIFTTVEFLKKSGAVIKI